MVNPTGGIDKDFLYGKWQAGEDKKSKLAYKVAGKALDIADDDVNINAPRNTTVSGIGAKGLVGAVAATALGTSVLGAALLWNRLPATPVAPPAAPVTAPEQQWDAVYEEQQPDGSWKTIRREKLK